MNGPSPNYSYKADVDEVNTLTQVSIKNSLVSLRLCSGNYSFFNCVPVCLCVCRYLSVGLDGVEWVIV